MTDAEKKLLQAKHRLEEAQARDRVKARKARTRLHFCQTASLAHAVGAGVSTLEAPVHGVVYCHPIPPPACVNLPPAAWHRYRGGTICSTPAGGTSYLTTYLLQLSTEEGLLRFTVALQKGR